MFLNLRFFQNVESYMAYLTDKTNLISNPGIRPGVREDVLKIAQITGPWKNMSYDRYNISLIFKSFWSELQGGGMKHLQIYFLSLNP